jgi:hypothetical protein
MSFDDTDWNEQRASTPGQGFMEILFDTRIF